MGDGQPAANEMTDVQAVQEPLEVRGWDQIECE